MSALLKVKDLTVATKSRVLLDHISFEIDDMQTLALVGGSGSGKSLTSLAIMRLLPDTIFVKSGDICFEGNSLFATSESNMQKIRGSSIAMIFQEPMSALNPVIKVGKQIQESLRLHLKLPKDQLKAEVISLLKDVALDDAQRVYNSYAHQLSGGQKQRVIIAMALACKPKLLIADEPTTALDVTTQGEILGLLESIKRKRGFSMLFISHDLGVVSRVADTIAVIDSGKIVEIAGAKKIFSDPKHRYTKDLIADAKAKVLKAPNKRSKVILETKDLHVHFKRGGMFGKKSITRVLDGVNIKIYEGRTLALVGESGSGKSTLAKAILSLLPLTSGQILLDQKDIQRLKKESNISYRKSVQIVFQDPFSSLDARMRVGEIIAEGIRALRIKSFTKDEIRRYICDILNSVGLKDEHIDRYAHQFSGGQRQRIAIARALAVEPRLIICDEPTSALDVTVRAQIVELLKQIQKQRGVSYLFITHDIGILPTIADDVAVMKAGKIVEHGAVSDLLSNPKESYTKRLISASKEYTITSDAL